MRYTVLGNKRHMDPNWGLDLGFPAAGQPEGSVAFPQFLHLVAQELTIAGLLKYPYTLAAMAIDEDKELDLRMGMGYGSAFLAQLGESFGGAIRNQPTEIRSELDVVARYEDLFLFSFPNTDFNEAMVPMRRLIQLARREAGRAIGEAEFAISISCGLLTWEPITGPLEPADFVYRTIEALYQAKKETGNKLFLYRMGLKDEDPDRLRIKHNQTAPLRLKTKPNITGLIAAPAGEPAAADAAQLPAKGQGKKKKKKKRKKTPFWKFW